MFPAQWASSAGYARGLKPRASKSASFIKSNQGTMTKPECTKDSDRLPLEDKWSNLPQTIRNFSCVAGKIHPPRNSWFLSVGSWFLARFMVLARHLPSNPLEL